MRRVRVTGPARRDIIKILRRSGAEFGDQVRQGYRILIEQGLQHLSDNAARAGVRSVNDIRKGYFTYHLTWCREDSSGFPVLHPRHLITFYIDDSNAVIVARVFHERHMLSRHLVEPDSD